MKIKCPLHIMYFTFVNPHYARWTVPLQYSLHRFAHCQTERPKGYEEFLHTRSCVSTTVFFYCLTLSHFTIFFFNNLHWFFLYVDSFLPFLQKQWKDSNVNVFRRQLAWLININSCRPNNPLVTTSSVSDLIISNVHIKDWEEKCSELNYLLNYSQKLSI